MEPTAKSNAADQQTASVAWKSVLFQGRVGAVCQKSCKCKSETEEKVTSLQQKYDDYPMTLDAEMGAAKTEAMGNAATT